MNRAPFIERLKELLDYDARTGKFSWRYARPGVAVGPAGTLNKRDGYVYVCVDRRIYLAHRLAWLYVHGDWPADQIDHINGDPSDNRLANLREVTNSVNGQNQRRAHKNNKSGLLGVHFFLGKWKAAIGLKGRQIHLGTYKTPEEAHKAYLNAKRRLHSGCTI